MRGRNMNSPSGMPARRLAIPGTFRRDASERIAFRQEPRKTLALSFCRIADTSLRTRVPPSSCRKTCSGLGVQGSKSRVSLRWKRSFDWRARALALPVLSDCNVGTTAIGPVCQRFRDFPAAGALRLLSQEEIHYQCAALANRPTLLRMPLERG